MRFPPCSQLTTGSGAHLRLRSTRRGALMRPDLSDAAAPSAPLGEKHALGDRAELVEREVMTRVSGGDRRPRPQQYRLELRLARRQAPLVEELEQEHRPVGVRGA